MAQQRLTRSRSNRNSLSFAKLEPRQLLASIYHNPTSGVLYVTGDNGNNVGEVSVSRGQLNASIDDVTFSATNASVTDVVFIGYDGDDTYTNNSNRSATMYGHRGNDTLIGGGDADRLIGGPGNDAIKGNDGNDLIVGVGGDDTLDGGKGNDRIFGTAGQNTIHGGDGNDVIYGSEDIDTIYGDGGIDRIYALGGDDFLYSGPGGVEDGAYEQGDVILGHGGDDTIIGESGLDIFWGGGGNDTLTGGTGENRLHGQNGNDIIEGGSKSDYITGGNGNDTLTGAGEDDFVNAGGGTDTAVFTSDYDYKDVRALGSAVYVNDEWVSGAERIQFGDRTISADQAIYSTADQSNFSHLNEYRIAQNRIELSKPQDLADYAENWSQTMARNNRLEHSSASDLTGLLTDGRRTYGENIIWVTDIGQSEAEVALYFHNQWRNSASHNANMLNRAFSEVGVGIVKSGGRWWGDSGVHRLMQSSTAHCR